VLWIYVLLTTVGVVATVPTVLRAVDGEPADLVTGFTGSVGLIGGLTGLFCRQSGVGGWATFVAAGALGLAAGALHPDLLSNLRGHAPDSEPALSTPATKKKPELTHDES
jgi:hypothetical protein